jgi:hypothetical protein
MCWLHEFSFSFTKERQQERYMRACVQKLEPPIQALPCCAGNKFKLAVAHQVGRVLLRGFLLSIMRVLLFATSERCATKRCTQHTGSCSTRVSIDFSSHLKGFVLQCRTLQRARATDCSDSR